MLETLDSLVATQGGENAAAETISRKDVCSAYLAGIVDGEGCIHARFAAQTNPAARNRNTLRIAVSVYNTHPALIKRVTECLVMLDVPFTVSAGQRVAERPGASVNVEGKGRVFNLLQTLLPYLTAKKSQAELVLELIAYRESLAVRAYGIKGRFEGMNLQEDETIQKYLKQISAEKKNYASVLDFPRKPNLVFGESSTTLRSPNTKRMEAELETFLSV